jgi:phosphatidate phosphatase LPIN
MYICRWCEDVGLSLCGLEKKELFAEHEVSWSDLASDPALVNNPKLVIKLDGKLYSWKEAAPIVVSLFVFNKPLPQVYFISTQSLFLKKPQK